jgi:hypothetical protein
MVSLTAISEASATPEVSSTPEFDYPEEAVGLTA